MASPPALDLPADATAPRLARRHVAELIGDAPRLDELVLCVSEVVTNAVLHGRPPVRLDVDRDGWAVRVEVHDGAAAVPVRKAPEVTTPTGRGLRLLDTLTIAWSARDDGAGKVVWFTFDLLEPPSTDKRLVRLLSLPVDLYRRSLEHDDTLRRELAFVAAANDPASAPARLRALSEDTDRRYAGMGASQEAQIAEAISAGRPFIDVDYTLPPEVADVLERALVLVEELDEFCRSGELLTLMMPPDVRAYRHWLVEQVVGQLRDAAPPQPWSPEAAPQPVSAPRADAGAATSYLIAGDLDLERAAEVRADLAELIESGTARLVIDLAQCTFVDSAGLSLLLTMRARCQAAGGSVTLVEVGGPVRKALEIAGVFELLTT